MVKGMTAKPYSASADRYDILKEIAFKWSKFSPQELIDITTNDELVELVVAKYGSKKEAAQREVDILMDGRKLAPDTASSRL